LASIAGTLRGWSALQLDEELVEARVFLIRFRQRDREGEKNQDQAGKDLVHE